VTIAPPPAGGAQATATAKIHSAPTEVGMVPALPGADEFPIAWTPQTAGQPGDILDGRWGGVPDPVKIGPDFVQIANEGGFLPAPAVISSIPIGWDRDPKSMTAGNIKEKALLLGPAERADVIVDFSAYAGKTLILYNDGPAPVPTADSRLDYYTNNPDLTDIGGSNKTLPGYGPSTRTIMQIKVNAVPPAPAYNLAALQAEFASTAARSGVFARSQEKPIVPQGAYNGAYNATYPTGTRAYARVMSTSLTFTPVGETSPVTIDFHGKTIAELFDDEFGRMSAILGVQNPAAEGDSEPTVHYGYSDPVTETIDESTVGKIGVEGDGTQIWKISNNGAETHVIHFHFFNVQLVNRVDWAGTISPPDPNELGWKETVRMNPLEDAIVALRPVRSRTPFGVPDSVRPLDPTSPIGSALGVEQTAAAGRPAAATMINQVASFGHEYVWQSNILSHQETGMMRPMKFVVPTQLPAAPALSGGRGAGATVNLAWVDGTPFNYSTGQPASTLGNPQNEIGFKIERAEGAGAYTLLAMLPPNTTTYIDKTAAPNTAYNYRVTAFNAAGDSTSDVLAVAP
jgi:FtsP/CotA-like multicopper oxidase with cupredoxin domain